MAQSRLLAFILALVLAWPAFSPVSYAQPVSRLFPETGKTVKGTFLQYWNTHGGLAQQGYPISEEMEETSETDGRTYTVQYFERAVFELHTENQPPHDVLLSLLGVFQYKLTHPNGAAGQKPNTEPGSVLFPETGKRLGGKFLSYWRTHGGLPQQGYPISDEFTEVSPLNGKPYTVQYFERAVFELHPEHAGTEYEVLLSQLGKFQYDRRYLKPPSTPTAAPTARPTSTPNPAISAWLREHAIPFNTHQPGTDYSDLMPLKEIIGDARIVSLGEATHGTKEFFQMKHRMLEFLVKEMDFNVFAIEATWPESNLVNDYVHTGVGDPATLLRGLYFWTWNTEEVLDMIRWMRAHNQSPGGAPMVSFFGFDMQFPGMAMDNVVSYVQRVDPPAVESARANFECFRRYLVNPSGYKNVPQETKTRCREGLQRVYDDLRSRRTTYESRSSPQDFARALQSARVAQQGEDLFSGKPEVRDRYMAENVSWLLEQAGPEAKVVLWSHNGHAATHEESHEGTNYKTMGQHLREQYGNEMRVFGFDLYSGSFNAFSIDLPTGTFGSLGIHRAPPPPDDSYEFGFASANIPRMFLDIRGVQPGSQATDWLLGPRRFRSIGSVYDDSNPDYFFWEVSLPRAFDVVIYFQDTTPSALRR